MRSLRLGAVALLLVAAACSSKTPKSQVGTPVSPSGGAAGSGGSSNAPGTAGTSGIIINMPDASAGSGGVATTDGGTRDPQSCAEAVMYRTYLGCEYFPTVLGNVVSASFDFAVVVANAGNMPADVTVTGPNAFSASATVAAQGLSVIALPWVTDLKGPSLSSACAADPFTSSVLSKGGAYHLIASRPVAAYQFNPLEFRAAGGPPGKVWGCVPGTSPLCECNSYSNDASLLLPVNALSSNYTAFTWRDQAAVNGSKPSYIAVTATADQTEVAIKLGPSGAILAGAAGSGIAAQQAGAVFTITLDAGDVLELQAVAGSDLSGTQVQSTSDSKPIQVMTGSPSARVPTDTVASSDHIEEIVPPAESLGHDYLVTVPTGPYGTPVEHVVRLFGHSAATDLSYYPAAPAGAPSTLAAYAVAEFTATSDFQVQGSTPFGVGSFLVGGQLLDPTAPAQNSAGDPSESFTTALPQYRDRYVFLAPIDYENNFVDVTAPSGTTLTLDGVAVSASLAAQLAGRAADGTTPLGFDIYRLKLDAGTNQVGAHLLETSAPVGIQVVGYGRFTSYQYPGGLNLNLIADPPPPIIPK